MNQFYTYYNYNKQNNQILYRYVDFTGESKICCIEKYPLEIYEVNKESVVINASKTTPTSLFKHSLKSHNFETVAEYSQFLSDNRVKVKSLYGHYNPVYQFISKEYPDEITFDYSKINVTFVDIECKFDDSGFPEAAIAAQPITAITLKRYGDQYKYIILGINSYTPKPDEQYIQCPDEATLLKMFVAVWSKSYPDIIVGFNNIDFDIPYIINRIRKVCGSGILRFLSPFHKNVENLDDLIIPKENMKTQKQSYSILGVTVFDYMELYKTISQNRLESYSLDSISGTELGAKKMSYKEEYGNLMNLYLENHQLYIEYNRWDVDLLHQLESKLKYILLSIQKAYIGKARFEDSAKAVKFTETFMYSFAYAKNIHLPIYRPKPLENVSFTGAYCKQVIPGTYRYIVTFDVTSLYPTIKQLHNVSPETKVRKIPDVSLTKLINQTHDNSGLQYRNQTMLANGVLFTKDFTGLIPEMINYCFKMRKAKKSEMLKLERANHDDPLVPILDATQNALKLIMNSTYGVFGTPSFQYFDLDVAEGITITGRAFIQYVIKHLNILLNRLFQTQAVDYVIFSDTDSVGITLEALIKSKGAEEIPMKERIAIMNEFAETVIAPEIAQLCKSFSEYFNCTKLSIYDMKREALSDIGIWRKKKNYIMQIYDNEGVQYDPPILKARGIQIRRSDTPIICRNAMEKGLKILLNSPEVELQKFMQTFESKFFKSDPKEIGFPKGVSDVGKWNYEVISDTLIWKKKTPIHVKAALAYNHLLERHNLQNELPYIANGNKIKFVYLKRNPYDFSVIGFIDELPKEFGMHQYIDYETQFEKSFKKPFYTLTDLTDKSPTEITEVDWLW